MTTEYVEQRSGGYYIRGTRVSLDSVVMAFLRGESPEGIADSFPVLTLEQVFGTLAHYMANRELVDDHLRRQRHEFEVQRKTFQQNHPALHAKLIEARLWQQTPA